ncbi:MotE family protein [Jeotgalibacillus proteolyticus]|uniref:Magnesium transporter MgtE intracellular domain-containing protein n=1 Tax=Jeotgalibacillus proteolyticus TaxID=2082395 RepID=A0A2S5GGL7_9BACL|nr:MotE family protein [Jeotgalibacillus proteolyticus]PPA72055.1 hypothetical protein C4B60_01350 [Jeotgalibacillus proteolyticus]
MNKPAAKEEVNEAKSAGKLQVFLMIVFIPAIFLLFAGLAVFYLLDINVLEEAQEAGIPVPFLSGANETLPEGHSVTSAEQIEALQMQLKEKDSKIAELENTIKTREEENTRALADQERLNEEISKLQEEEEETSKRNNEMASVFKEMSGKTAAPVLLSMNDNEAADILRALPTDTVAKIFEKMPPADAAKYAQLLADQAP